MRILVLGHLAVDVDHVSDTEASEQPAGIYRTVAALSALREPQDTIVPVCAVPRDEYRPLVDRFEALPGVETIGLYQSDAPVHRVHFYRGPDGSTTVCAREIGQAIPFERIKKFLDVQGILINMTSGSDLSLDTLDEIRLAVRPKGTPIHLDLHNLARGVNDRFERILRPLPEWRRWTFMVDTVQGTEEEIKALSAVTQTEEAMVAQLFTLCVKRLLVTRGSRGATLYRNERKQTYREDIPAAVAVDQDAVGAGDVCAAAFMMSLLRSGDERAAAGDAVAAAEKFLEHSAASHDIRMIGLP